MEDIFLIFHLKLEIYFRGSFKKLSQFIDWFGFFV